MRTTNTFYNFSERIMHRYQILSNLTFLREVESEGYTHYKKYNRYSQEICNQIDCKEIIIQE